LPKTVTKDSNNVLFADDTSIIVTKSNDTNLKIVINKIFLDINKWLKLTYYTVHQILDD